MIQQQPPFREWTVADYDRQFAKTLAGSNRYQAERAELGDVVIYRIFRAGAYLGKLKIAPSEGIGVGPLVGITPAADDDHETLMEAFHATEPARTELQELYHLILDDLREWDHLKTLAAEPAAHNEDTAQKPRVPKRLKNLNDWRACWRKIKPEWRRGRQYHEIREWLDAQDTRLAFSEDILGEIIKAGEAGLLDPDTPENSR